MGQPIVAATTQAIEAPPGAGRSIVSTQPLVLVADDEPRITKLVAIALFGCAGVLFLYAAFLGHQELYAVSWRAAGILFLAITGAVLFHEAIR